MGASKRPGSTFRKFGVFTDVAALIDPDRFPQIPLATPAPPRQIPHQIHPGMQQVDASLGPTESPDILASPPKQTRPPRPPQEL